MADYSGIQTGASWISSQVIYIAPTEQIWCPVFEPVWPSQNECLFVLNYKSLDYIEYNLQW